MGFIISFTALTIYEFLCDKGDKGLLLYTCSTLSLIIFTHFPNIFRIIKGSEHIICK
jgi:hypothetical protein